MAAKPPMPPDNHKLNGNVTTNNNYNNNSNNNNKAEAFNKHKKGYSDQPIDKSSSNTNDKSECSNALESELELESVTTSKAAKQNCNCTNISIMHLFHEMKQEFPTIPDSIVTQCVIENCHHRENCIQMLKKELALHPIPVQTYPSKVLQQQQQEQQQQQQVAATAAAQRQLKPPTPLKPSRAAPLQPPPPSLSSKRPANVPGGLLPNSDSGTKQQQQQQHPQQTTKDVRSQVLSSNHKIELPRANCNPGTANTQATSNLNGICGSLNASGAVVAAADMPSGGVTPTARARPTTLNLSIGQQQRQVNAQLQQKLQQRQQQQQQQQLQQHRPLRKAPLPPLPPKPHGHGSILANTPQNNCSNDSSCLTSPMSSSESEISLNVSLSSPTSAAALAAKAASTANAASTVQQPSPIRHRSVITLQPDLPYARDFLSTALSPTLSSSSCASSPVTGTPSARKSFTSLNLTLRQPHPTTGAAQSTIDITAGPAPSGTGSGITYTSSSFDARRGTQKNFQLTVTDAGSVFSAGCVRAQPPAQHEFCNLSTDGPTSPTPPDIASPCSAAGRPLCLAPYNHFVHQPYQQPTVQPMPEIFPYPTQAQNHIVASNYNSNHLHNNNSAENSPSVPHRPLYTDDEERDLEAHRATIERQKKRRDKLANALRDNKKRLSELEQEINILTEPVPVGASERLDKDIKKLKDDCQYLLNLINDTNINGSGEATNSMNRQNSAPPAIGGMPQQNPPQPFRRQRAPPYPPSLNSLPTPGASSGNQQRQPSQFDFVQNHSSAPASACITPHQQQHEQPPPTYEQYYQSLQEQREQEAAPSVYTPNDDEEYLSESDVDEGEEPLDMWACNMCTFRNHPQLNMCEACENIRIKPAPLLSREDIHITLSPGENRIIHSWILS
ncbi:probable serine/threonine-protein kinase nek3 isoform X2 [Scaptodrosophila lebanonensis]|uniref:Probable serine/threonine-protein kinase nek3 isoform X2 n=1 Tax=Drosophila lebanonensis TaxID=7225 RepID=A0A6J2TVA5_DROLE|nr:probable serine/threonine-protein kinase nek3 isoform X2 [Scaptodrosophila lebanonensis]